jgi:hypothetical protein
MNQAYKRCVSCGDYFVVNEENKDSEYCSKSCEKEYEMCMICGNYFEPRNMVTEDNLKLCKKCSVQI